MKIKHQTIVLYSYFTHEVGIDYNHNIYHIKQYF